MEAPASVELTRCDTGKTEIARIVTLDRETAKSRIDQAWWKELVSPLRDPTNEPDWDWEWRLLVSKRQNKWYFQSKCIVSQNGGVQAAIQFRVDAISAAKPDEQAVFVDRLATAPRNREGLTESPLYRGEGDGLLLYAVAVSHSLGFGGRVNLFPIAHQEFYVKRGFQSTKITHGEDVLFELPAVSATAWLRKRGLIDG